jgi:hypothetical protein
MGKNDESQNFHLAFCPFLLVAKPYFQVQLPRSPKFSQLMVKDRNNVHE